MRQETTAQGDEDLEGEAARRDGSNRGEGRGLTAIEPGAVEPDSTFKWYSHNVDGMRVFRLLYYGSNYLPRFLVELSTWFFGSMFFLFLKRERHYVVSNMAHVLGGGSRWKARWLAYRNYLNFSRFLVDVQQIWKRGVSEGDFTLRGVERIERALAEGRGAILLTAHMGNWEVGAKAVAGYGRRMNIVVMEPVNRAVRELLWRMRSNGNINIIPVNNSLYSTVAIIRALKRNELVGIQGDRPVSENCLPVDFFGSPARFPVGPILIAMATGSPLVPCFILQRSDGKHEIRVEPPILIDGARGSREDLARNLERVARVFEEVIREHPEQWFCFHPVWEDDHVPAA